MSMDYVMLCGAMWCQYGDEDAGWELVRALHSQNDDVVMLASRLLESGSKALYF